MKNLKDLTKKEYNKLIKADLLQVLYPEATGDYDNDCNNGLESYEIKNELYERYGKPKFKNGNWVKVVMSGHNASDFNNLIGVIGRGVYELSNYEKLVFRIDGDIKTHISYDSSKTYCYPLKWNDKYCGYVYERALDLADTSEIEQHLIEEAKRRGYRINVVFGNDTYNDTMIRDRFYYKSDLDVLYVDTDKNCKTAIYSNGIWAEIIKEESIKVGGYEVEFTDNGINVGCKNIDKYDVYRLKSFYDMVGKLELSGIEINAGMASLSFVENNGDVNTVSYEDLCKIAEKLQD